MAARPTQADAARLEDDKLHRHLGFWSLLMMGLGSVIGSGWLFSTMYATQVAGPAAFISWIVGGGMMLLVALVYAELGMVKPESGGTVRYPLYSNGQMAATIVGLATWLAYVGNAPTEAAGIVQYAAAWLPGVYDTTAGSLTATGIALAVVLMMVFVVLNYFGVQLFAKANNTITVIKMVVPVVTIVLLVVSGFDHNSGAGGLDNLSAHGGFAPMGWGAAFGAIVSAGLVFAYTGFSNIIGMAGEVANPRRDIPRALIATIVVAIVLYLVLQFTFIIAVPSGVFGPSGWAGINFDSPYAHLAQLLGLTWLYWLILADAAISPAGTAIVYTAANARNLFSMAKNGFLPRALMRVHPKSGIPRVALITNFVIGLAFLLPLPSWHAIVSTLSGVVVFTLAVASVSLYAFRMTNFGDTSRRLRGMAVVAPAAFIVSSLVVFWAGWTNLWPTIPIIGVAVGWWAVATFVLRRRDPAAHRDEGVLRADVKAGMWLLAYIAFMYLMSMLASVGGIGAIGDPWGLVLVAVGSFAFYVWGVRSGAAYMRERGYANTDGSEPISTLLTTIDTTEGK